MMEFIFSGPVDIYLQGEEALEPTIDPTEYMEYFVGCSGSKIIVRDYRVEANNAAKKALANPYYDDLEFADVFSQPAIVDIRANEKFIEIDIKEFRRYKQMEHVLWLGVSHNGRVDRHISEWETVRPITQKAIAFAALIRRI